MQQKFKTKKKRIRQLRHITATCTKERFREFYTSISKIVKSIKLIFIKALKGNSINFSLKVVY